jgi:hypothetical protein
MATVRTTPQKMPARPTFEVRLVDVLLAGVVTAGVPDGLTDIPVVGRSSFLGP